MNIIFAPRGILQVDDARITHKNFAGKASRYNKEGERNFSLVIPDKDLTWEEKENILDIYPEAHVVDENSNEDPTLYYGDTAVYTYVDILKALGWNVRIKPPRNEGEAPFMYLPIKVAFNGRGPAAYLVTGNAKNQLDEEGVACFDDIDILSVNLDIRPYDWQTETGSGRKAYLQAIEVVQRIDRFAARHIGEQY